jgi:tetratricopeptide (TPR) repeat protein
VIIKRIIFFWFFITGCSAFAQLNTDSLKKYFAIKDPDKRVEKVTEYSWDYSTERPDSALYYVLKINKDINSSVKKLTEAYNYHIIGALYLTISDYENARLWLEKAYKIRKAEKDYTELSATLINLIYTWQGLGDVKQIHKYVFEAEDIYEKRANHNPRIYIIGLNQLAETYGSLKRYDKAEDYFLKAIKRSEEAKSDRELAMSYQNYAGLLIKMKRYDEALTIAEKGLLYEKKLNNVTDYFRAKINLAIVYSATGRKNEALAIFREVYAYELKGFDKWEQSTAANNLGTFYLDEKQYSQALKYLLESLDFAIKGKAFSLMVERYKSISECYEGIKDYKSALKYTRLFQNLNDSIFNSETVKQLHDLTERFDTEKKEKKILELNKNNAEIKLKEAETKRESQRNNIIFGSLMVLVLIIAFFIYFSLVQKKKANSALMLKNEQINSQHHLLEEKQKEILDSIHYAKRIQQSLMPTEKYFTKNLTKFKKNS